MGIYTHTQQVLVEGSIDGPKDHLSMTTSSNDQHGPRRIILRGLMVEPWSNHIFRAPRRISCILRGYPSIQTTLCCPSQTRRIVDLVNLQTDLGHRFHTDRIQTKYRHKCTNKLPLGCSFVFIFYGCRLVSNFDGLWSSSYQNSDVLTSLQCRRIFKVFTS
ncbi:hypothetical protein HanRHA438_Chr08g0330261 [Helianthus annuus]|nr:hypothetical protein HanRHA438_Chr08g0330261 [Helianthus annuus]